MSRVSIIIPTWNERLSIETQHRHWLALVEQGAELLFVDGGSHDGTSARLSDLGFRVVASARGRARQMNCGAAHAQGEILLFLHADTRLPVSALFEIERGLVEGPWIWGRFDVSIAGSSRWFPLISAMINWRSRLTGIATGDQAIFVRRDKFSALGGFPDQALMEDIELSKRLGRLARPLCLRAKVHTSGRRWETRGVWTTILLMWRLRLAYWLGASPETLASKYR